MKVLISENSKFFVDEENKQVRRVHTGDNGHWHDDRWVPYERYGIAPGGFAYYFDAVDPDTGEKHPFVTSLIHAIEDGHAVVLDDGDEENE